MPSRVRWALPTTPSIHPPPTPPPQPQGPCSFNCGCSLAQAFYIVRFCKDGSAVEGDQNEKDCLARSVGASIIGHLGVREDTLGSVPDGSVIGGWERGHCPPYGAFVRYSAVGAYRRACIKIYSPSLPMGISFVQLSGSA